MPRHSKNASRRRKRYSMNTSASQSSEHSPDSDYEGPFDKEQDRMLRKCRKRKFELDVASDSSESLCSEDYEYLSGDLCSDDLECCSKRVVEKESKKLRKKKRSQKRYKVADGGDGDDEGCSSLGAKQSESKKIKRSHARDKARNSLDATKETEKRCRNAGNGESNDQGCRSSDVRGPRDSREADASNKAKSRAAMVDASTQVVNSWYDKEHPRMKDACTQVQAPLNMQEDRRAKNMGEGNMEVWNMESIFGPCKRREMYRDDAHAGPSREVETENGDGDGDRSEADAGRSDAAVEQAELNTEVWNVESMFGPCKRREVYRDDVYAGPLREVETENGDGDGERSEADAGRSHAEVEQAELSTEVWNVDSIFGPCKQKEMYRDDAHAGPLREVETENGDGDGERSEAEEQQAGLERSRTAQPNKDSASDKELGVNEGETQQDEFGADLQQNGATESESENEGRASVPTPSITKNSAAKYFGGPAGYNSKGMMRSKFVKNKTESTKEGKLSMKKVLVCKTCYLTAEQNNFEAGTNPLVVVENMIQREEGEAKKVFARPRDLLRHYTNVHNRHISPDINECYLKQLIYNHLNSEVSEENYQRMQKQEETISASVQLHAFWYRDDGANRAKYNQIVNTIKPMTPTAKTTVQKEEDDGDDLEGFVVHDDDDSVSEVESGSQYAKKYVDRRVEFDGVQGVVQRFHAKKGVFSVRIGGETVQWSLQDVKARLMQKQRKGPPRIAVLMDLEREKRRMGASRRRVFQAEDSASGVGAKDSASWAGAAQRDIAPAARASDKDPASDPGAGAQDVDSTATWSDSD